MKTPLREDSIHFKLTTRSMKEQSKEGRSTQGLKYKLKTQSKEGRSKQGLTRH